MLSLPWTGGNVRTLGGEASGPRRGSRPLVDALDPVLAKKYGLKIAV
jgi:hypothetical protein